MINRKLIKDIPAETILELIAGDRLELSYEKIERQRDEYHRLATLWLEENKKSVD